MRTGKQRILGDLYGNVMQRIFTANIGNGNEIVNGKYDTWGNGDSAAPTGWTWAGATIAKESSVVKVGVYAVKMINATGTATFFVQQIESRKSLAYYQGKTITYGAWVKADNTNVWLEINDGTGSTGGTSHTGDNTYQWLTVTRTISGVADKVWLYCITDNATVKTSYISGAVCKIGASLASTESLDNFELTSITIPNLNGDVDEEYKLEARIVNGYNGSSEYRLRPNNDSGTNYGFQYLIGSNTAVTAKRGTDTGIYIGGISALGLLLQDTETIQAKSGYVRTAIQENASPISGTTITNVKLLGWSWNNTADEITSLVVLAGQTNGLGVGTVIELFAKRESF